ncbi:DUF4089 domain-containing protein [Oculatella sp. LEGE 06141]|uniref:DUF4089 domain-containing protein n=1 Tax=Oculatella sp. LEGE 06141 TaxID=1828648 RepID=UPI001880BC0F|nr:DUF4089 domain-containing protein [Oculatella sp. LEGE 06141]MBE9177443.1 DUF4089 domain-containing protein [Oculatella sp. LEGE 06141]
MVESSFDAAAYVDQLASALHLPIEPDYRPGVIDNMARIAAIAQLVNQFPLPDDMEAAPIFQPVSSGLDQL